MKDIVINRIRLENFKCHRLLELDMQGTDMSIYGDNASGKSSIYDGLTWLLFGKDSHGNGEKNMDIKPLGANGEVLDHNAITAVEAELAVNGEPKLLRRTYRETWTTRRGCSEPVYDGNSSEYSIDQVPMKKNAFDAAVAELVNEDLFRILTSVTWFASGMKWQERRNVLFDMAGSFTDAELLEKSGEFPQLQEALGRNTLTELKSKLLQQRKGYIATRDDTPARLSECQRTLDSRDGVNFTAIKADAAVLEQRISALRSSIKNASEDSRITELNGQIREREHRMAMLEQENRVWQMQNGTAQREAKLRQDIQNLQFQEKESQMQMDNALRNEEKLQQELMELRQKWMDKNRDRFDGDRCPTCGQQLPAEALMEKTMQFDREKLQCLEKLQQKATVIKHDIDRLTHDAGQLRDTITVCRQDAERLQQEITALAGSSSPCDMPGYQEKKDGISRDIIALEKQREHLKQWAPDTDEYSKELAISEAKLQQIRADLAWEDVLKQTRERMEQLAEQQQKAAESLNQIDGILFEMESYLRYKSQYIEGSINRAFSIVRFRMFREQANGGLEERCDVTVNGVPYTSLNSAMQINAGIDIINALSRYYGVRVPLFVDNAESVTRLKACEAQVIRLVVSENDKELRMV